MKQSLQELITGRTRIYEGKNEQGEPILDVRIHEITPFAEKLTDELSSLTGFAGTCGWFFAYYQTAPITWEGFGLALGLSYVTSYLFCKLLKGMACSERQVLMTTDTISFIRKRGGPVQLDRTARFIFALEELKNEAEKEKLNIDCKMRRDQLRRRVVNYKRYYQHSRQLILQHEGLAHVIADIYDPVAAGEVRAALDLCDAHMDAYLRS